MMNIMKDVKDDNNVTNAKHDGTNEKVKQKFILLKVVRIDQIKQKRRMNKRRNEDWNK